MVPDGLQVFGPSQQDEHHTNKMKMMGVQKQSKNSHLQCHTTVVSIWADHIIIGRLGREGFLLDQGFVFFVEV